MCNSLQHFRDTRTAQRWFRNVQLLIDDNLTRSLHNASQETRTQFQLNVPHISISAHNLNMHNMYIIIIIILHL